MNKERIIYMFRKYITYTEIAKIFGVTPERIRQIIRSKLSRAEIDEIRKKRSIYKAVWSRTKESINENVIQEAKKCSNSRNQILQKYENEEES